MAADGGENVVLFKDIREIRVLGGRQGPNLIVSWKEERRPQTFLIESKWIPDGQALLKALQGRVAVLEK